MEVKLLKAKKFKYLGYIPGVLYLSETCVADIGEAVCDNGDKYYITWGRNINIEDIKKGLSEFFNNKTLISENGAYYEIVIPDDIAKKLLTIINYTKS